MSALLEVVLIKAALAALLAGCVRAVVPFVRRLGSGRRASCSLVLLELLSPPALRPGLLPAAPAVETEAATLSAGTAIAGPLRSRSAPSRCASGSSAPVFCCSSPWSGSCASSASCPPLATPPRRSSRRPSRSLGPWASHAARAGDSSPAASHRCSGSPGRRRDPAPRIAARAALGDGDRSPGRARARALPAARPLGPRRRASRAVPVLVASRGLLGPRAPAPARGGLLRRAGGSGAPRQGPRLRALARAHDGVPRRRSAHSRTGQWNHRFPSMEGD